MSTPLLRVEDLRVHFSVRTEKGLFPRPRALKAVDGISFELQSGETLGIVGESGCGKSTLARGILGLVPVTGGRVYLKGQELTSLDRSAMRAQRRLMQIVFQDPLASLNPRMTVGEIIAEPLRVFDKQSSDTDRKNKVTQIMQKVGLLPNLVNRYPHEFSGGQCQRIGIARALILNPELLICDEPVSALDVSIQAQIVNLLKQLQDEYGLGMLFIAHDLSVVRHISHRVMVMYLGRAMEAAGRDRLFDSPLHPYTQALISSVPIPDPELERSSERSYLSGELPSPLDPPSGCSFRNRCPLAETRCAETTPALESVAPAHHIACWKVASAEQGHQISDG